MKRITAIIICIIMVLTFTACGGKTTEEVEFGWGTLDNGNYTNESFDFSIDISPAYKFLTPQEIINETTRVNSAGESAEPVDVNSIVDLSLEPYVQYVYGLKYPEGVPTGVNPSIKIYSENMKSMGTMYSKEAYVENYLDFSKMVFNNSNIQVESFPIDKPWIDERQFANGKLKILYADYVLHQSMYAIIKGNYVFVILLEYTTEAEKTELESFIDTIKVN